MIDKAEHRTKPSVEVPTEKLKEFQEKFGTLSEEFDALSVKIDRAMDLFEINPLEQTKVAQEVLAKKLLRELSALKNRVMAADNLFLQEVPEASRDMIPTFLPESARLDRSIATMSQDFYLSLPLEAITQELCDECMLVLTQCHNHEMATGIIPDNQLVTRFKGYYIMTPGDPAPRQAFDAIRDMALGRPELEYSPVHLDILQKGEDNIYKLHLNVDSISYKRTVIALLDFIYKSKGEAPPFKWKLRPYNQNAASFLQTDPDEVRPTVVFYILGGNQAELFDKLRNQAGQIKDALQQKNVKLPPDSVVPRYNAPVVLEGQKINGLFYAQSDGGYKTFLKKRGALGEAYDANKNYAVRIGQPDPFE